MPVALMTMDHNELVSELPMLEKISTAERLKLARKRRSEQLKRFGRYEKSLDKENNKAKRKSGGKRGSKLQADKLEKRKNVKFVNNIMLLEAAARNDLEEVNNLLNLNVSPDVTNEDGLTALHQCCIDDNENMARLLVEFGANVNAQDSELWTPLHAAATCGHVNLCKFLIEKGADLLAVNADGNMPYDICEDEVTLDFIESEMAKRGITQELIDETRLATEKVMLEDLKKLAAENADLDYRESNGATPLHIAAANGYLSVAQFLLENSAVVDAEDNDSWQPIHAAACWGQPALIELLVRHGADLDAKTRNGETPFDICEDLELRQRILDIKEDLANNRKNRKTALTRKPSSNTRSASIRRSSMREKSMISWKEAREEAKLRSSISDDIDGLGKDDAAENESSTEPPLPLSLPPQVNGDSNGLPSSNIDEINIKIMDDDTKTSKRSEPVPSVNQSQSRQNSTPATPDPALEKGQTPPRDELSQTERNNSMDSKSSTPIAGTLSELKRQRQEKNASLRHRPVDKENDSRASSISVDPQSTSSNGTTPLINMNAKGNNEAVQYVPKGGDSGVKKYKAENNDVVGQNGTKQSCCIIL